MEKFLKVLVYIICFGIGWMIGEGIWHLIWC